MDRISLATRREIVSLKLQGYSNQEAADACDVSKGTVANVMAEARSGQFTALDGLEERVDALVELGDRLDEADLTLEQAHVGLDVLEWLADLGISPANLASFRDRLGALADDDQALEAYGQAAIRLRGIERATGYQFDGQLEALLDHLDAYDEAEIEDLADAAAKAREESADAADLEAALDGALRIQETGFAPNHAAAVAEEIAAIDATDRETAIARLAERYEDASTLDAAIDTLSEERERLEIELEGLRDEVAALKEDRESLRTTMTNLDMALSRQQATLTELREGREELQEMIDRQRRELEELTAAVEEAEADLEAIDEERAVVHAFRRFIASEEISPVLLSQIDLLQVDSGQEGITEDDLDADLEADLRTELDRLLEEMRSGEEVIPRSEHEETLRAAAEEWRAELLAAYNSVSLLADQVETLQQTRDERWTRDVAAQLLESLDADALQDEAALATRLQDALSDLLDQRVEHECTHQRVDRVTALLAQTDAADRDADA